MVYTFTSPLKERIYTSRLVQTPEHFQRLLKPGPNDYLLHWSPLPPIPEYLEEPLSPAVPCRSALKF